jgi:hypothetical protein
MEARVKVMRDVWVNPLRVGVVIKRFNRFASSAGLRRVKGPVIIGNIFTCNAVSWRRFSVLIA